MQPLESSCTVQGFTGPIAIRAIKTGEIEVKTNFLKAVGPSAVAKLGMLADHKFAPPIPIYSWVIVHPEGVFVVDTGENARSSDPRYFDIAPPMSRWLNKTQFRFHVQPEEEVGPQLTRLGINPAGVKRVIMTHLHIDHTDGLEHFAGVEVLVHEQERRKPFGEFPYSYPTWFNPTLFNFRGNRVDVFDRGFAVTAAEDLVVVPTPGHTPHHCSVLLRSKTVDFLFAGDVSYTQDQLLTGQMAAPHADFKTLRQTYAMIKCYARQRPTVYLPSHDPMSEQRLINCEVLDVAV